MSQAPDLLLPARSGDMRIIASVSAAHFVSHFYILLLPPLFAFVRDDYGVSYTELGLALTAFNAITAVFQTPTGFLVDWIGGRRVLIGGLILGSVSFAIAGLIDSFWVLIAMFAIAGFGNTAYHPADYSILSKSISHERIGEAFSVHAFSGMLGTAVAPAALLFMQSTIGWRGAFVASGAIGLAMALWLTFQPDPPPAPAQKSAKAGASETAAPEGLKLLLSGPILANLLFYVLLAITFGGVQNYSVVALNALHGTPFVAANAALTAFLLLTALGVLVGGMIVGRTARHVLVSCTGLVVMAATAAIIGIADVGTVALIGLMAVGGLFNGVIMPSRDMIVRAVTPPGSYGKVFGFVTTGFNIGGIISPLIFGALMDHGSPAAVFLTVAVSALIAILTVMSGPAARGSARVKA